MIRQQYYDVDDDDVDSICNELVYPPIDGGFYSDAGYQSPGLNMDNFKSQPGLFSPITPPECVGKHYIHSGNRHNPYTGYPNTGEYKQSTFTQKTFDKKVKNIDLCSNKYNNTPSANQSASLKKQFSHEVSPPRYSKMKAYIENTGFFYVPPTNSLLRHNQPSPSADMLTKDENISPVTISSGYSSDKEEALRQLDLEYASDDHQSPMQKGHFPQLSPSQISSCIDNKDRFVIRPDEFYDKNCYFTDNGGNKTDLRCVNGAKNGALGQHVESHLAPQSVTQKNQHSCKKSKDIGYNRRNSIAVNPSHANSLEEVKKSLSNLTIQSNDFLEDTPMRQDQTDFSKSKAMKKRPVSTTSNVSIKDTEKLPEMLPAGVRTSYTTSSGILMAPEASRCRRCFSFATSPVIKSPSQDLSHFRVSKDSAFRLVKSSSPRSNSTPPQNHFVSRSLEVFHQGEEYGCEDLRIHDEFSRTSKSSQLLMIPNGSRVASLSDSGRGSASSIDLALNDLPPFTHEDSVFTNNSTLHTDSVPVYQDMPKEQIYETVPERPNERYYDNTIQTLPPKLPKRNARSTHRTPRSARKTSSLVKYEDIVKPQDIVDPSAMHMYTVADVLKSVDRLSSDIPQSSNDMCIHDDYAHFVFDSKARNKMRRSSSHTSLKDTHLELSIACSDSTWDDSLNGTFNSSPRGLPKNLNMPLQPRQNTACEARNKRLPKIKDAPNTFCNSPCSKNKAVRMTQRLHTEQISEPMKQRHVLKSPASRTLPCAGHRARSQSLVRPRTNTAAASTSAITWSPRGNMTEVYC